jgi:hypothetical protein
MANPLQQAATLRKVTYFGLIILLFAVSMIWRGKFRVPFSDERRAVYMAQQRAGGADPADDPGPASNPVSHAANWLSSRSIATQVRRDTLDLSELEQGDPELAGSLARLSLVGSRGIVITALWRSAIEKFKRNEWHDFETRVRMVTRLQPNFITPWIYQSWNLSYNVSVENERLNDMYYYIARGIELLSEGERLNRDSPDMRYQTAFYYQNKFGVSDKVIVLRSLFQLSCMKPDQRDASRFRGANGQIDMGVFRKFCRDNPQLVRRLREKLNYVRPEQVVQFLADNDRVPTRWHDASRNYERKSPFEQFPALPLNPPQNEARPTDDTDDTFDAFLAAKSWFAYGQVPLPPTDDMPGMTPTLTGSDRFKYRIPKQPMLVLFRQSPARAQTYYADRLQAEGWVDSISRWQPDLRADSEADRWFESPDVALATPRVARDQWAKAFDLWEEHGKKNGLKLTPAMLANIQQLATGVPEEFDLFRLSDEQLKLRNLTREQVKAKAALRFYEQNRSVTNFEFFLSQSEAERDADMSRARRLIAAANETEKAGNKRAASAQWAEAITSFRQALRKFPEYHRGESGTKQAEENLFEYQMNLVRLIEQEPATDQLARKQTLAARSILPGADDDVLRQLLARQLATREAAFRVLSLNPHVQDRADEILRLNHPDRKQEAKYPSLLNGREALVRDLVSTKDFKHLWEFMSDTSADDSNRWVGLGVVMSTGDKYKVAESPSPGSSEPAPAGTQ